MARKQEERNEEINSSFQDISKDYSNDPLSPAKLHFLRFLGSSKIEAASED